MPLNTVNDMQLDEYQELFKDFFAFKREKGILEIRMHTDGKEAKWSKELHARNLYGIYVFQMEKN